jgi:hypothetical protein
LFGNDPAAGIGKSAEQRGEYHIGRGQIIMMARELRGGYRDVEFHTYLASKPWRFFNINTETLTFEDEPLAYEPHGTIVIIRNEFDVAATEDYIKRTLAFFPIPIYLNGVKVTHEFTAELCRCEHTLTLSVATVHYNTKEGVFYLYDRGIYIAYYNIIDGFSGFINTHVKLRLNFARNDVMEDDENWCEIVESIRASCVNTLLRRYPEELTNSQLLSVYKRAVEDKRFREAIWHKKFVKLANGTYLSLAETVAAGRVYYAEEASKLADVALQQGYLVVVDETALLRLLLLVGKTPYPITDCPIKDVVYKEVVPTAREREVAEYLARYTARELRWGESDWANAWTDGRHVIWLNRRAWNAEDFANERKKFVFRVLKTLAHELGHRSDTRDTDKHGIDFKLAHFDAYMRLMDRFFEVEVL